MRLLPLFACAVLLTACHKSETQKLAESLRDGTKDPNKAIIIIGMSFDDNFRPDDKNPIYACLNQEGERPKQSREAPKCDAMIKVEDLEDGRTKEKMLRVFGIDRRKVSLDRLAYSYKDEENNQTYVRAFNIENPPFKMLANYGDIAYVGDFHFSVDEDIETEKPRLKIQFENDYAGFKEYMGRKDTSADNIPMQKINGAVNLPLNGYAKPLKITTQDDSFTTYVAPRYIYVPRFK